MYNITVTLDPDSRLPMYEQLYKYFVVEISSGRLRRLEKLPSKRALCAHLGVSRSTVENAYGILAAEGFISSKPRSGYYVSDYAAVEMNCAVSQPAKPLGETEIQDDKHGIDFSTATVDTSLFPYSTWAKLNKEVVYSCPQLLQRGDRQGELSLRSALASFLGEYRGVKCRPDQMIVGAGMEYLTDLLLQLFPSDTVLALEDPGYSGIYHTVLNNGRPLRHIPLDEEGINMKSLYASGAVLAYVTPSHQFPMGITMPASRRSQLLLWAAEAPERYIIEDDYDSEFRYYSRPIPAMQSLDSAEKVIYIGTFSRSLAPSVRIAYMVLPDAILLRYRAAFGYSSSTVSRFEQEVMARFISGGYYSRYLRKVGNLYKKRCAALSGALAQIPGISVSGSDGGIHFLISSDTYDEEYLFSSAQDAGIFTHRLSSYCRSCEPKPSTLVLGYGGISQESADKAAAILRQIWSSANMIQTKMPGTDAAASRFRAKQEV